MAKLGLLFIAVFCVVQIALAARLPRETPTTETNFWDSAKTAFSQIGENLSKTLTKENADKILKTVEDGAKDLGNKAKELADGVGEKFTELSKDAKEKFDGKDEKKN